MSNPEPRHERLNRRFLAPPARTPTSLLRQTSTSGRSGEILHVTIFIKCVWSAQYVWAHVPPDVHAWCETVWGFRDTIPDITAIKGRLSLPASSSDYLTAGSGLQWLIPRQSPRLVQHTEKECIQRPDDENKNTCRGSRPKKDMPPPPSPLPVMLVTFLLTLLVGVTLRLNVTSSQSLQAFRHRFRDVIIFPIQPQGPAQGCAD